MSAELPIGAPGTHGSPLVEKVGATANPHTFPIIALALLSDVHPTRTSPVVACAYAFGSLFA